MDHFKMILHDQKPINCSFNPMLKTSSLCQRKFQTSIFISQPKLSVPSITPKGEITTLGLRTFHLPRTITDFSNISEATICHRRLLNHRLDRSIKKNHRG